MKYEKGQKVVLVMLASDSTYDVYKATVIEDHNGGSVRLKYKFDYGGTAEEVAVQRHPNDVFADLADAKMEAVRRNLASILKYNQRNKKLLKALKRSILK